MADTASLKEILFRDTAEQCKVCEAIPFDQIGHQIEYEKFKMLHERLLRKLTWRTSTRNGDRLTDMYRKVVRV